MATSPGASPSGVQDVGDLCQLLLVVCCVGPSQTAGSSQSTFRKIHNATLLDTLRVVDAGPYRELSSDVHCARTLGKPSP